MAKNLQDYYNLNRYYNLDKYYNTGISNPYLKSQSLPKVSDVAVKNLVQAYRNNYLPINDKRGALDRIRDTLMVFNYSIAGGVKGGIEGTGVLSGIGSGLRAANPFGKGYEKGEITFSDVLESGGWKPEGIGGKIAKCGVGLALDILLDPLTYLSGGLSGVVKGTGKVGLKATHATAIRKFAEDFGVDVSKGLSVQDATRVILHNNFKSNQTYTDIHELRKGAEILSKEFNKVIGIQPEVRDLTWSLKNVLFGEKLFPNAKVFTLAKAESIQKLGDVTLAPLTSSIRNSYYGGKLGERFSNIASLYKLSKTDPEGFYDCVRHIDVVRGLYGDKVTQDLLIREYTKKFVDLTPAENKQLLEIMQDPSKWHYVTDMFNYLDTKFGQRRYAKLAIKTQKDIERLERLKSQREYLENAKKHNEELKDAAVENLAKLEDEVRDELLAIDLKQINDEKTKKEYIKLINEEIVKLKGQKAEITSKAPVSSADESKSVLDIMVKESEKRLAELTTEGEKISKAIKELGKQEDADLQSLYKRMGEIKSEIKEVKTNIHKPIIDAYEASQNIATQRKQLSKLFKMVEEKVSKEELVKHIEENKDLFDKVAKERLDDIINSGKITYAQKQELYDFVKFDKYAFCKQLSQHLGGVDDLITYSTYDRHIETLIKLMKDGVSNEDMLKFIDDNRKWFDGTANFMYDFIAKQLNYERWHEVYDEPLKQVLDVIRKTGKVTARQQKTLNDLEALKAKRDYWIQVLGGKSISEMEPIMREYSNRMLLEDVLPIIEGKKTKKAFEKYQTINPNPEDYTRIMEEIVEKEGKKRYGEVYNAKLTAYERDEIYNYLIEHYMKLGVKNFGRGHNIMFHKIIDEVEKILINTKWTDEFGEKTKTLDWLSLAERGDMQEVVIGWAIKNYNSKPIVQEATNKQVTSALARQVLKREEERRLKQIIDEVCSSDTVDVKLGGKQSASPLLTVQVIDYELTKRGEVLYHAVDAFGRKIYFNPEDVVNIYNRTAPKTIDELVVSSEITKKTINRSDELLQEYRALQKEAKFTKEMYSVMKSAEDANYKKITDEIKEANRVLANRKATLEHIRKQSGEFDTHEISWEKLDEEAESLDYLYHGVGIENDKFKKMFIDKDGNLILKSSVNFNGKQQGISLTPDPDVAFDYAMRIKGVPLSVANNLAHAKIIRVKKSALSKFKLSEESSEEIMIEHSGQIKIAKGDWQYVDAGKKDRMDNQNAAKKLSNDELFDEYEDELIRSDVQEWLRESEWTNSISKTYIEDEVKRRIINNEITKSEYEKQIKRITWDGNHSLLGDGYDFGIQKYDEIAATRPKDIQRKIDIETKIEKQIADKEKEIHMLQTNLKAYTQRRLDNIDKLEREFEKRSAKIAEEIEQHEAKVFQFEKALNKAEFKNLDKLAKEIEDATNALNSNEIFDTYWRTKLGDKRVDRAVLKDKMDVVEVALNDNVEVSEKVRHLANFLRSQMMEWGREEVTINKLRQKQLNAHMLDYLPHIATPDGERLFATEMKKGVEGFGQDFGYGKYSFNPYAKSRTMVIRKSKDEFIANPTIEEINEFWADKLKGRNVFSETISDIFLVRGLKHNELMYDDKYMRNMLDMFGYDLPPDGILKEGYKPVMNFGMLKDTLKHMSNLHVKTEISDDVNRYLSNPELIESIRQQVAREISELNIVSREEFKFAEKKLFGEKLSAIAEKYIKKNYPMKKRAKMFERYLEFNTKSGKVKANIEDIATPLIEMTDEQIKAMQRTYDFAVDSYLETIKRSVISIAKSDWKSNALSSKMPAGFLNNLKQEMDLCWGVDELREFLQKTFNNLDELDAARMDAIYKKLDNITSNPLQIKQVNEAIVEKANRMRKMQLLKDNHAMLVLWDKVLHLIKLNQTTVIPAFHARNKLSNTFNNWLLIGKDAVDPELQVASAKTMYYMRKSNAEAIRDLTIDINGTQTSWSDLYHLAMQYGVLDGVFFLKDLGTGFSRGLFGKHINPKYDPTDAKNFIWYKKGAEIGSAIEGQDKLLNFVACLRNGKSVEEAAESSIKALFDYSDITAFERNVMKRIIPYYTWLRKNAPYQLEMMLEDPKKFYYISKIMHGIEGMNNEEDQINRAFVNEFAKDWVQTPFTVTNPQGRKEVVMWNPNLPFMDLGRIPDPFNFVPSMVGMFNQMNPMIRVPIEQAMNYNAFFESPIVGEDESQLNRAKHVFNNFAMYNVGRGFVQKSGIDLALHALNATTGLKFLSYDYDAYKAMKLDELHKKYDNPQAQIELAGKMTAGDVLGLAYKGLVEGFEDSFSKAVDTVGDKVMSSRPMRADEYTDALRPISQAKYERLSDEEKEKYTPPTEKQAIAYHKKAVELEQEQLAKSGTAKKYIWSLFETMHVGERNKEYVLGEVVKVTDGDTFNVKIGDEVKTVRMLLIDTPESVKSGVIEQPLAMRASEYTKKSLLGKDTKIVFDVEKIDNYNRVLGYVEVDGVDFNEELLKEGLAKVGYIYKNKNRLDKYRNAEKEAFEINKGIWSIPEYAEPGGRGYYQTYYDEAIVRKLNSMAN